MNGRGIVQQRQVSLGEWVMSQLDARLGRGYSSVRSLDRLRCMPELHVGFGENDSSFAGSINRAGRQR